MHAFRLLRSITTRPSLSSVNATAVFSASRAPYDGKFGDLINTWTKSVKPQVYSSFFVFRNRFCVQACHLRRQFSKLKNQGGTFTLCNAVGLSALIGSINAWPRNAYAMGEDFGALLDDGYNLGLLENPKTKKGFRVFLILLKKLIVPIYLVVTIFMNWGRPLIIVAKVTLTLYLTKPSPLSIYFLVEEMRNQVIQNHPFIYRFKLVGFACIFTGRGFFCAQVQILEHYELSPGSSPVASTKNIEARPMVFLLLFFSVLAMFSTMSFINFAPI